MLADQQGRIVYKKSGLVTREEPTIQRLLDNMLKEQPQVKPVTLDGVAYMPATLQRSGESQAPRRRERFSSLACGPDGKVYGFMTPVGTHRVLRKTPTRHMVGGPENTVQYYDLPGVPWCTYFYGGGAAIHGAFWHNDFGRLRSHGCVNVTNDAAKWIYRWTLPTFGPDDRDRWLGGDERKVASRVIIAY